MTPDELSAPLTARLRELWGGGAEVTGLRRLPGGASRETWSFDAAGRGLILRCESPDQTRIGAGLPVEAAAFTAARAAGVPVPEVLDAGDGTGAIPVPYLLQERLDGETIPRRLLRDERFAGVRSGLAAELGRLLAAIHAIPAGRVPGLDGGDPLAGLTALYDGLGDPRPAVELGLRWLRDHRPPPVPPAVVHGDFRLGNLLVAPDGVRGVLDWELVHTGDPAEDLGWLCVKAWRFGSPHPVGGLGSREELLDGYEQGGGRRPDAARLRWWEVYGTLRWTVLCRFQAERHLSGAEPSIELAALGRRVCEQEHDLLLALGHPAPAPVPDVLDGTADVPPAPHDRPGAHGLLEAVGEFLAADVRAAGDERLRFHALVAANLLRVARREMLLGPAHRQAHRRRLAALGAASDADLARAIRAGTLDAAAPEVIGAVRASVTDRLAVASPGHLRSPA
ncbi:phosphotransferase family protein [Spirillospora sp. CA-294931]|uniref:phosphotransferase family protein n=1 Tax=Spirillospora sp. CA-294931 TaxID=3240042 RepID=UPI003D915D97